MTKYTDNLWQDLAREHGAALAHSEPLEPGRARILRRPRLLAGSVLGLAGAGVGLLLTAGSTPAYAVTTNADGAVQVTINQVSALPQANAKLAAMGTREQIAIQMAPGAAPNTGPVTCVSAASAPGAQVTVMVGTNGTEVIPAGNTGAGTWHLASCSVTAAGSSGTSGTSGTSGNG